MEERLQKYLANNGIAARRKCEEFILDGRVKVNSKVVTELGTKINPDKDIIEFDGKKVENVEKHVYILLNKPIGYVTTVKDQFDRPTVLDLVKIKENTAKTIEEYKEKYGSDTYGITAYVLNTVRIYSIPLCFLGIAVSAIYQYVIGIRKLDTQEKGLVMMVSFITIFVICQILPLAFAIVVKFGRG